MNTYYTELFALTILAILFHFAVIIKRYTEKILVPYFFNAKVDWNPNIDRIKLLFSSFFLLSPILLTRSFIKFNSSNLYINYLCFALLIALILFCIWFDIKKIKTLKPSQENQYLVKKGRKNISFYKVIALSILLEEKFFKSESEFRKSEVKINFCEEIVSKTKKIKCPKTLANNITSLEKENLDTLFKYKDFKKLIPFILEDERIKDHKVIIDFLKEFENNQ